MGKSPRPSELWAAVMVVSTVTSSVACAAPADGKSKPTLQYDRGPVRRTFGAGTWLVYACSDGASLVAVTGDKSNPAFPSYFLISPEGGSYGIEGEGTGSKAASDLAQHDLSALTPAQIATLRAAAEAHPAN